MIKFKVKMQERIFITDDTTHIGSYVVKGRQWTPQKGLVYELQPDKSTAVQFLRLFLNQDTIYKQGQEWAATFSGNHLKCLETWPVQW